MGIFLHHVEFFSFADEAGFAFYSEAGALVAVSSFDFSCAECHDDAVVDGKVFFQVVHAGCGSEDSLVIGDNEVGIPCVCDMGTSRPHVVRDTTPSCFRTSKNFCGSIIVSFQEMVFRPE